MRISRTTERLPGSSRWSPHWRFMERLRSAPYSDEVWAQYKLAAAQQRHRFFGLEWFLKDKKRLGELK